MQVKTKNAQREYYKKLRKKIPLSEKNALDTAVFENLKAYVQKNKSKKFLVYVSNGFEIDTTKLIRFMLENSFAVYVPKCSDNDNVMDFYRIYSFDDLEKGHFGILEPTILSDKLSDFKDTICLVPAVCYDKRGYRIGFGKGFYDRFFYEHPEVFKVGVGYDNFVIDEIYKNENDVPVDIIITDTKN